MRKRMSVLNKFFLITISFLLFIALLMVHLNYKNYKRAMEYISSYVNQIAEATSDHIKDVVADKMETIDSISILYSSNISEKGVDISLLSALEENTEFDRLRFIDLNGVDYTTSGETVDVSDREYFKEGLKGNHKVFEIFESRVDKQRYIGFSSPVYYNNEIFGLIIGFMNQESISKIIKTRINSINSNAIIIKDDGIIVGGSFANEVANVDNIGDLSKFVYDEEKNSLKDAIFNHKDTTFSFNGYFGKSIGASKYIDGTNWSLLIAFPSFGAKNIIEQANRDIIISSLILVISFLVVSVVLFSLLVKGKRDDADNSAREKLNSLLRSLSGEYLLIMNIDIASGEGETYILEGGHILEGFSSGRENYKNFVNFFARKYVVDTMRDKYIYISDINLLMEKIQEQGAFYFEYDCVIDGQIRNMQNKYTFSTDENNRRYILSSMRDITNSVKEREEHKLSIKLVVAAASIIYPFIMEVNNQDNSIIILNNNKVFKKIDSAVSISTLINSIKPQFFDKFEYKIVSNILYSMQEDTFNKPYRYRQLDEGGNLHWMEITKVIPEAGHFIYRTMVLIRCVDEEVKLTKELEGTKEAAEASNKAKTQFLFNMSHYIRTPMNAILGFAALAVSKIDDKEKVLSALSKIKLSGENLLGLINNVLDMARIEQGKEILYLREADIERLLQACIVSYENLMMAKNITLKKQINIVHNKVLVDETKFLQIINNVLANAIKYSFDNGTILLKVEEENSIYHITIKDEGIGISKEFLPLIFDMFEKEKNAININSEGTGIGLSVSKRFALLMNGDINVESEVNEGTTVYITLLLKSVESNSSQIDNECDISNVKILIAEDNDLNAEITVELLSDMGATVKRVNNGRDLINILKSSQEKDFDIILMDIKMPYLDGFESAKLIRNSNAWFKDIPIIAITGNSYVEDKDNFLESGMNGFVNKPIDFASLKRLISSLV